MKIFLVSETPDSYRDALSPFTDNGHEIVCLAGLDAALPEISAQKPQLVIFDESQGRKDPQVMRKSVMKAIATSAFTHTSAISSLSGDEFHDAMEGLGMILPVPAAPSKDDARRLLSDLESLLGV